MGKALKKIFLTLLIAAVIFVFVESVLIGMQKRAFKKHSQSGIFFWGDSQLFQAINTDELDKQGVDYFSQCQHGAGYYDLMNFVASVPEGSDCIIGYTVGFYRSRGDRNIGGLSLTAVQTLLEARQKLVYENQMGLREILMNNAQPQAYYFKGNKHPMYADLPNYAKRTADSIDIGKMKINAENINIKLGIYEKALAELKRKKCSVHIVVFSVHPKLAPGSDFANVAAFQWKSAHNWEQKYKWPADTLHLNIDIDQAYYDYTHLTGRAATAFTQLLLEKHKKRDAISYLQIAKQ